MGLKLLEKIKSKASDCKKTIVLPESHDERVLKAAEILTKEKIASVILIGNDEVIHLMEDSKTKSEVVRTTMKEFRKKNGTVELVMFPEIKNGQTTLVDVETLKTSEDLVFDNSWSEWFTSLFEEYGIHTRKETLHRAKGKTGRMQIAKFNNSEHFAWWCKIGLKREDILTEKVDKTYNTDPMMPRFPLPKKVEVK